MVGDVFSVVSVLTSDVVDDVVMVVSRLIFDVVGDVFSVVSVLTSDVVEMLSW